MKILLTGADGYIGCLAAPILEARGHEVVGLDNGYYRDGWLYSNGKQRTSPRTLSMDLRDVDESTVQGFDAVVHLAELSNDPLGQNNPENTFDINHGGSVKLARLSKAAGVPRFVYTSSCSVYGIGLSDVVDENSPTNPQTAYAKCKVLVEQDAAYGPSPRMRFDIVLNNLAGLAWTTRKIAMTSDGTPWRPLVHVLDICQAIACSVDAPSDAVHGKIFNVGSNDENYQVREIAEVAGTIFPGCEVTFGPSDPDNRSYRVNFDKIHAELPGFHCEWTIRDGADHLREVFERIDMDVDTFEYRAFTRLKQLEYLIRTAQLDERFYWRQSLANVAAGAK
jgi:nucleoside-diphosphate-sugar epimerase